MPIGEITDYFYRVEFLQRGSPHIHGLFCIKNAPQYEKDSNEKVVTFVDKFITCHKPNRTSEMEDLVKSIMTIGEITDYFYRVEFLQRGSPHIHGLFCIKNAPQYEKDSNEKVVTFVDKFITCHKPNRTSEMEDLVNLQMHRHAKTCKKGGNKICRFNFPIPPMPKTMILKRFDDSYYDEQKNKVIKENSEKIKVVLDNMKFGEDITFEDFLKKLQLTQESYLLAIRYTLKRDTLFLKRLPSEIRINSYNTHFLQAWQANMDIQYVLDPYACATYILSYITKGQRGMSRLLEKATEEARAGNEDIVNRVRHIGNKFLNAVEISAQEAVYLVLQMPLRRSSRDIHSLLAPHLQKKERFC